MELSKKTTILLTPGQHAHLTRIAKERGVSLGELVRRACAAQFGIVSTEDRMAAVEELRTLELPVSDPDRMKRESVPEPKELRP